MMAHKCGRRISLQVISSEPLQLRTSTFLRPNNNVIIYLFIQVWWTQPCKYIWSRNCLILIVLYVLVSSLYSYVQFSAYIRTYVYVRCAPLAFHIALETQSSSSSIMFTRSPAALTFPQPLWFNWTFSLFLSLYSGCLVLFQFAFRS